jgi:hypothetical protein
MESGRADFSSSNIIFRSHQFLKADKGVRYGRLKLSFITLYLPKVAHRTETNVRLWLLSWQIMK